MNKKLRVAILDLYEGQPNQGMRCLKEILTHYARENRMALDWQEFEVRIKEQVPGLSHDIYISSGGPGSPLQSEGSDWEKKYFHWLGQIEKHNADENSEHKKYVFFICHSFQLVCRHYRVAMVSKRKSTAFGVFPVHLSGYGKNEPVFEGLRDPFYAVDSRDYQITQPNLRRLRGMGAHVLAIEKERPHVPLERAVMAMRLNKYMLGTQFHPEADAGGMSMYLRREDKKKAVIAEYGEQKWRSMIEQLNDPDKIRWTYSHVIPNFLNLAVEDLSRVTA